MGVSAFIAFTSLIGTVAATTEAQRSRRQAAQIAAQEREALAKLQAEPEPVLPSPEAIRLARRRSITGLARRRGRASTILSDSTLGEPLGT